MILDKEGQVRSLVEAYAPPDFVENEEACSYLCSLLASDTERHDDHDALVQMIHQFFEQDADEATSSLSEAAEELAKRVAELFANTEQDGSSSSDASSLENCGLDTSSLENCPLAQSKSLGGENFTVEKSEESVQSTVHQEGHANNNNNNNRRSKAAEREKRQQQRREKKAAARRQRQRRKIHNLEDDDYSPTPDDKHSITTPDKFQQSLDDVDDSASAWAQRRQEGKAWGGRGAGGRGVRGDVNTASNIHLTAVSLQYEGNELLENSTIQISGGHRYGLIGRNGCGKSTLLRRLAGKAIPGFPQDIKVLLVKQQVECGKEPALEALLNADEERSALLAEQAQLEQLIDEAVEVGGDLERKFERLGTIAGELDAIDADRAEERARDILRGLQFNDDMIEGPTENLSGGWRMRLALAQALFVPSDLLLLDEPTNHLDLFALLWLTEYLANSNHTLIVVSHDRAFLDMCTDIISFEHKKLKYHVGNFSAYEQQQEENAARQAQILDASERQRTKAVKFVQQQQQASAGKKRQDPKKQRQAKMVKEKKLDRIGNYREDGKRYKTRSLKKLSEDYLRTAQKVVIESDEPALRFKFPDPTWAPGMMQVGSPLLKMDDVSFGYVPERPPLLQEMTLDLYRGSKVAVVGKNGAGKSTLMKLITGELAPTSSSLHNLGGDVWRHPCLRIGHITQHSVEDLDEHANTTVVDYAEKVFGSGAACSSITQSAAGNIRQYLGAFGLGGKHAKRPIGSLSGGERMRLCFATVLAEQPHLLVLDESTNHIDMETLDSLAAALDSFKGAVVIVSHNQGFLCGFCKELWVVENGHVDVRHSDTQSFEEVFSQYKTEAMTGAKIRGNARAAKAKMAKRAKQQRAGTAQTSGFIG